MRILGLDFGTKTIGIAVSDELGMLGHGVGTIRRRSLTQDLAELRERVKQYNVQKIIIGLPLNMDGSAGESARRVLAFAEQVKKECGLPVETWDERLSTVEAQRIMLDAQLSRKKRKKIIDTVAAAVILQDYLDHIHQQRTP
jgi:putative Holliday junction resolvase